MDKWQYNRSVAPVIHISEAEAASDFASVLARVRAGAEVGVIESEGGKLPLVITCFRRSLWDRLARLAGERGVIKREEGCIATGLRMRARKIAPRSSLPNR